VGRIASSCSFLCHHQHQHQHPFTSLLMILSLSETSFALIHYTSCSGGDNIVLFCFCVTELLLTLLSTPLKLDSIPTIIRVFRSTQPEIFRALTSPRRLSLLIKMKSVFLLLLLTVITIKGKRFWFSAFSSLSFEPHSLPQVMQLSIEGYLIRHLRTPFPHSPFSY